MEFALYLFVTSRQLLLTVTIYDYIRNLPAHISHALCRLRLRTGSTYDSSIGATRSYTHIPQPSPHPSTHAHFEDIH